jgi:hypothetical protein
VKRYDIGGCMIWVLFERARISCIVHDEMAFTGFEGIAYILSGGSVPTHWWMM